MAPKAASKAVKRSDAEAQAMVEEYLLKQNRPYSITDVQMNLRGAIGKTQITKTFDALEAKEKIVVKLYGKQKVFLINQNNFPELDPEEVKKADDELKELEDQLTAETNEERKEERQLAALRNSLTNSNLAKKIDEIVAISERKDKKLEDLASGTVLFSKEDKEKITKEYTYAVKQWKRRKRTANEMIDQLSEGMNEKPKKVCEMIGVETDEEMNATLKEFPL